MLGGYALHGGRHLSRTHMVTQYSVVMLIIIIGEHALRDPATWCVRLGQVAMKPVGSITVGDILTTKNKKTVPDMRAHETRPNVFGHLLISRKKNNQNTNIDFLKVMAAKTIYIYIYLWLTMYTSYMH